MNPRCFRDAALACTLLAAPLALSPVAAQAAPRAAAAVAPKPFVSDRIYVRVVGQGPDVVLIPGLASSSDVWDSLVARYSGRYRLHLVQVAGFAGAAPPTAGGPVFEPAAREVARYIREAGLNKPAVIGHSLGGAAALDIAETDPDLIGKVLIVDALPFFSAIFGAEATPESAAPFADGAARQLLAASPEAFAESQAAGTARLVKDPEARARVLGWSVRSDRATMANAVRDLMVTDLRPGLGKVTALVTVLYAWDEAMGPVARIDDLWNSQYAPLKGVKMVRVDASLHFIMYDQPEKFLEAVGSFLGG